MSNIAGRNRIRQSRTEKKRFYIHDSKTIWKTEGTVPVEVAKVNKSTKIVDTWMRRQT